jgi:hypothetical protein
LDISEAPSQLNQHQADRLLVPGDPSLFHSVDFATFPVASAVQKLHHFTLNTCDVGGVRGRSVSSHRFYEKQILNLCAMK